MALVGWRWGNNFEEVARVGRFRVWLQEERGCIEVSSALGELTFLMQGPAFRIIAYKLSLASWYS
jgi:hypothetical protein